jgi:hypothetical protein
MQSSFKRISLAIPTLLLGLGAGGSAYAIDDVHETLEAFLTRTFGATVPEAKFLDLDGNAQSQIGAALGHSYQQSRLRYWKANGITAWVLMDKGKEGYQLTDAAFAVKGGAIDIASVLIYRESHGEEVADPPFLNQLAGAHAVGGQLDRKVDNIAGATLSVKMMERMAAAAIALDKLTPP